MSTQRTRGRRHWGGGGDAHVDAKKKCNKNSNKETATKFCKGNEVRVTRLQTRHLI